MRILHINHSADPESGGPIEAIKQSAGVLMNMGHAVELLCFDAPNEPWIEKCAFPVHAIGPTSSSYGYTPELGRWLDEHRQNFDAIIVNGLWQYGGFGTWRALKKSRQPYFVFPHGMLDPWFKRRYPLKHLKKWLYWPWAEYRVLRDATAVLFTCEEERVQARQSFGLYQCNEIVVNFGTANPPGDGSNQRAHFLDRFPELRGKHLLLFLGRIHEKKGCMELVEAFGQILHEHPKLANEVHLVMAGPADGEYAGSVRQTAERLELANRITWTGMLSGDLKWGAFHSADVFVLPSYQENFGIAVAEALACGVPVLISNKVNTCREIEKDAAGLIEDAGRDGTKRLLQRWVNSNEQTKQALRVAARCCFERRFEIKRAAKSLVEVLSSFRSVRQSTTRHFVDACS